MQFDEASDALLGFVVGGDKVELYLTGGLYGAVPPIDAQQRASDVGGSGEAFGNKCLSDLCENTSVGQ